MLGLLLVDQRREEASPHIGSGRRLPGGLRRLDLERNSEERPRRGERHGVHGDSGERETPFHLPRDDIRLSHATSFLGTAGLNAALRSSRTV